MKTRTYTRTNVVCNAYHVTTRESLSILFHFCEVIVLPNVNQENVPKIQAKLVDLLHVMKVRMESDGKAPRILNLGTRLK